MKTFEVILLVLLLVTAFATIVIIFIPSKRLFKKPDKTQKSDKLEELDYRVWLIENPKRFKYGDMAYHIRHGLKYCKEAKTEFELGDVYIYKIIDSNVSDKSRTYSLDTGSELISVNENYLLTRDGLLNYINECESDFLFRLKNFKDDEIEREISKRW